MADTANKIIELAIALYITAYVVGPALGAFAAADLTSVQPGVQTLFKFHMGKTHWKNNTVVPLVAVIGVALLTGGWVKPTLGKILSWGYDVIVAHRATSVSLVR